MTPESKEPFNKEIIKPTLTLEVRYFSDTELQQINSDLQKTNTELETLRAEITTMGADAQMSARHTALTTRINTLTLLKEERQHAIRNDVMGALGEKYSINPSEDPWEAGRGFDAPANKRGLQG